MNETESWNILRMAWCVIFPFGIHFYHRSWLKKVLINEMHINFRIYHSDLLVTLWDFSNSWISFNFWWLEAVTAFLSPHSSSQMTVSDWFVCNTFILFAVCVCILFFFSPHKKNDIFLLYSIARMHLLNKQCVCRNPQ